MEFLFRNRLLDARFKPARYHMLMTLRYQVSGDELPPINARAIERYCRKINDVVWDDVKAVTAFEAAGKVVARCQGGAPSRDDLKTQASTTDLLSALRVPVPDLGERTT